MKFIVNKISTGNPGSFNDFVKKFKSEHQIKTATTKIAEQEEADSSGQLDVEPLHQEGESTTMPKAGPSAKKEGKDEKSAAATKEPDQEGPDSGQPKAEGTEKFTNNVKFDSNDIPKEEKGGSEEAETKEAGKLPDALKEHQFKSKTDTDAKEEEKEAKVEEDKKEETKEAQCKKTDEDEEEEKEAKVEEEKEAKITEKQFVKVANLDEKNRRFLIEYWRQQYGDDYVNAMVAEK